MVRRRRDERDAGGRAAQPGDVRGDLVAGQPPPSPGLAPWAILISSCSAPARYAVVTPKRPEATWRIWLAARSPFSSPCRCGNRARAPGGVDVVDRRVPLGVLPALARVGAAVDARHGHGDRLVSLAGQRAERHAAGQNRGSTASTGSTSSAACTPGSARPFRCAAGRGARWADAAASSRCSCGTGRAAPRRRRGAASWPPRDRRGGTRHAAIPDESVVLQLLGGELGERLLVDPDRLLGDLLHAQTADARRCAREPQLDQVSPEPYGLEQLRPVVAGEQRILPILERILRRPSSAEIR